MVRRVANGEPSEIGRPPLAMPESIDDTPDNVARAILPTPAKKRSEWKFMQARSQICPPADEEGGP